MARKQANQNPEPVATEKKEKIVKPKKYGKT
jgi:hypothetical protein